VNMTELADRVASDNGLEKGRAKQILEHALAAIVEAANRGDDVQLSGFGRFKVADRPARQGRNPGTGATIEIAASRKLTFTAAKNVRDALNPAEPAAGARPAARPAARA